MPHVFFYYPPAEYPPARTTFSRAGLVASDATLSACCDVIDLRV